MNPTPSKSIRPGLPVRLHAALAASLSRACPRLPALAALCLFATPGVSRADSVTDWTVSGTTPWSTDRTVTRYYTVGSTAAATLDQTAGTISHTRVGDYAIFGQVLPAAATAAYNMSGTAHYSGTTGVILGNATSGSATSVSTWSLTDTASATIGTLQFGQASQPWGSRYLLLSGTTASFTCTVLSFNNTGTATNNMNYISFASGSTATFTANNKVLADYQAYVTAGNIRVDGATATWSRFQVSGHTLSLAPPPTMLTITVPPTGTVNSPFSVTVQAKDAGGTAQNVTSDTTVTLTQASGGGALSGTLTGVISIDTNSVTISGALYDTADTMTLTAAATSGMTLTPITSSGITFAAAYVPPTKLAYKTVPTTGTAGTVFSVTVEARDSGDTARPVSSDTTVTLSQASGGGTLSGTLTGIIPLGGTEVTMSTPVYSKSDTMTLTATPTLGMTGLTPVTSGDIVFSPGVLDHFTISPTIPSPQTAGTPITGITLTALDAQNNTLSTGPNEFTGTVAYSGTAGITGTSDAFTAGVLSDVSVTPTVTGTDKTFIITGSDKTGTSTFDVVPGAAFKLAFGVQPTSTDVGEPIAPAVTVLVQDASGNTVTGDSSEVTITSAGTDFADGSTLTVIAVDGVATFGNLKPTTEGGGKTLTASADALTGATSGAFIVGADTVFDWTVNGTVNRHSNRTVTRYFSVGSLASGTLNQDGGAITANYGEYMIFGQVLPAGATATYNMSGAAHFGATTGVIFGNAPNSTAVVTWSLADTASATIGTLQFGQANQGAGSRYLLLSGAATFTCTNLAFNNTGTAVNNMNYISFATGSTATFTAGNKVEADYQALVTAGNIRVDGVAQTDFSAFQVVGNTLSLGSGGSNPYTSWAGGNAFDSLNSEGVAYGMAWLLGATTNSSPGIGLLPESTNDGGKLVMTFDCLSAAARGAAVLKVQYSKDLGQADLWINHEAVVPGVVGISDAGSVHFEVTANGGLIHVVATIAASEASTDGKLFGRLQATE